jgi:hypothetical protein
MKTRSTLVLLSLFLVWYSLTSTRYPQNPPLGVTGAPGETTCSTTPGCHSGGNFSGMVTISGVPDTIVPNQTYTITLTHMSNAVRAGFEITALNAANNKAGDFTAGAGNNVASQLGRQYVRHSQFKTLAMGSTSWMFSWKSPAALPTGNTVTFYFASLAANGNNTNFGDNALTGTRTVFFGETVPTVEPEIAAQVRFAPVPAVDRVELLLPPGARADLRLFDLQGREVLHTETTNGQRIDVGRLPKGVYVGHITIDGKTVTRELVKN